MKRVIPIITLVLGLAIGWAIADRIAQSKLEKLTNAWSPEFQQFIADAAIATEDIDPQELKDSMEHVEKYANRTLDEMALREYHMALCSWRIKTFLDHEKPEMVDQWSQMWIKMFQDSYATGKYDDHHLKDHIDSLIQKIETSDKSLTKE